MRGIQITKLETDLKNRVLALHEGLESEFGEPLRMIFLHTHCALTAIATARGGTDLGSDQVALLGLVHRAHELFLGCLSSMADSNRQAFVACFRGLIETYGACVWAHKKPGRLPAFLAERGPQVSKLMNAAFETPGVRDDYSRLSSFVHPASRSIFSCWHVISEEKRLAIIACPAPPLSREELRIHLQGVLAACKLVFQACKDLLHDQLVEGGEGKPVMEVVFRGGDSDSVINEALANKHDEDE